MKISILIPAYKESKTIGKCLDSIIKQNLPDCEIIVSSPDEPTRKVVKKYQKKYKNLKLIRDEGKGKPAALNILFKEAKGDVLVLTDADVVLGKNSIKNLLKHFKDKQIGAVCGKVVYKTPKNSLFWEWSKLSEKFFDKLRGIQDKNNELWHPSGNLYAIKNGIVEKIPPNSLSDDAVIGYLVKSKGYLIKYEPKAEVYVKFPLTISDFIKQKSRTRAGFLQIKKWFGFKSRGLTTEILFGVRDLLKTYSIKKIHKMFFVVLVYLISWLNAYWIFWRKKGFEEVWIRAETTKH